MHFIPQSQSLSCLFLETIDLPGRVGSTYGSRVTSLFESIDVLTELFDLVFELVVFVSEFLNSAVQDLDSVVFIAQTLRVEVFKFGLQLLNLPEKMGQ